VANSTRDGGIDSWDTLLTHTKEIIITNSLSRLYFIISVVLRYLFRVCFYDVVSMYAMFLFNFYGDDGIVCVGVEWKKKRQGVNDRDRISGMERWDSRNWVFSQRFDRHGDDIGFGWYGMDLRRIWNGGKEKEIMDNKTITIRYITYYTQNHNSQTKTCSPPFYK
jgi:hypothetical protein